MLAIINALVETIAAGTKPGATILAGDDGIITAVGPDLEIPEGADVVDAEGNTVTPGLIEAHSHAGMAEDGFSGDADYNETTDPVTPHLLAIDGFKPTDVAMLEAAESGVTTMYLTQGSANVFCGIGAVVKTWGTSFYGQIVNPNAGMKMAMGENPKRVYGSKGKTPATRMAIAALMRETLTNARTYSEKKAAHSANDAEDKGPFETDLKHEAVTRLLAREFPARCHAHRATDMLTFMRIAEEFGIRYVFEHATESEMILEELAAKGVPLVIGPTLGSRGKIELHRKSFRTVKRAVDAGLTVAITSDHHVTPMRYLNVYAALAVREGLSNEDALKAITLNPAKILGIDDVLGSVEPGKQADLVVWSGDPLDVRSSPRHVFVAGKHVDTQPQRRLLFTGT